jgi:hypothetical protein
LVCGRIVGKGEMNFIEEKAGGSSAPLADAA